MNLAALKLKVREIKKNILVLSKAVVHPRTPWYAKVFTVLVVAYALSPIDLIPDFIPVLGYLDDLLLLPAGILLAIKMIPEDVLRECRESSSGPGINRRLGRWGMLLIIFFWLVILYVVAESLGFPRLLSNI